MKSEKMTLAIAPRLILGGMRLALQRQGKPWSETEEANGSCEFGYEFKYWYQTRPVYTGLQLPMRAEGNQHPVNLPPCYLSKEQRGARGRFGAAFGGGW